MYDFYTHVPVYTSNCFYVPPRIIPHLQWGSVGIHQRETEPGKWWQHWKELCRRQNKWPACHMSKKTKHVGLQIHMLRWWFFSYVPSRHSEHCLITASTSAGVRPAMSSVRNTHCWWGDARKNNFFVHFGRRDDLNVNYHKHSGGCLSYPCCLEDSIAIHVFWKIVQLSNPTPKSQNLGSCFLKEKNGPIFSQISFVN